MGRVLLCSTSRSHQLPPSAVVGRSAQAHIRVDRPEISRFHLMISWGGGQWTVRPISPVGLYHNGLRLPPFEDRNLRPGDRLGLGWPETDLLLESADPPLVFARNREDGEERWESSEGLSLPQGLVRLDLEQGWVIDGEAGSRPLSPATSERNGGGSPAIELGFWEIFLPELDARTRRGSLTLAALQLRLASTENLEHVQAQIHGPTTEQDLGIHAEFWPLLLLARARRSDPEGWVEVETLMRQSGLTRKCLDVYLGRVRRHLLLAGVRDAEGIIESRRGERRVGLEPSQIVEGRI